MNIGLFLSRDNGSISETLDLEALAKHYNHLSHVEVIDHFYNLNNFKHLEKQIEKKHLNAVILAGNSVKYYTKTFAGTSLFEMLNQKGINESRFAVANIREHVAWPHKNHKNEALNKARLIIDSAIAKVESRHDLDVVSVCPRKSVLIIGTRAGGLLSAHQLLQKDFKVFLIEKGSTLHPQSAIGDELVPVVAAVQLHPNARIILESQVEDISGWCGEYKVKLRTPKGGTEISVGGIILSVGQDTEWISALSPKMQLDIDDEGHLMSQERSIIPGMTKDPGIWFIPTKNAEDLVAGINGANMAVQSLTTVLDRKEILHPVWVSEVDPDVCGGCGTCVKTCAFSASKIDLEKRLSVIDLNRCKGCGNCVSACPTGARDLVAFPEKFIFKAVDILSEGAQKNGDPRILAFLCTGCGYPAADSAGELASTKPEFYYSPNILPLQVECGGSIDTQFILHAFSRGFDGVALTVCRDGHCHHIVGNTDMERRVSLFREVLRSRGIDAERMRIIKVSPHQGKEFHEEITKFTNDLQSRIQA